MDTQLKTVNIRLRVTPKTRSMLKELAENSNISATAWIDQIIAIEHRKMKKTAG
jgi:hypothetical protein